MAKSYRYLHFDVFTDRLFGGNQLAVFPDGRGLSAETMQAIANEMNFSETTFVLPAERSDTDVRMRIFTPSDELPMAGHPTIGSMFALVRTGLVQPPLEQFVFGLGVGPVPVSLTWKGDDLAFAWMTQLSPTFGPLLDDLAGAAAMLGLPESAVGAARLPVQVASCGMPCLFVPIASRREVDQAVLDRAAWSRFMAALAAPPDCAFFFSLEPGADKATAYSRMFAPSLGIGEDPATGGASGPLGCYLVRHGAVTSDHAAAMLSLQGVRMGRPSHVHISIGVDRGEIVTVRVGGTAVFAGEGLLYLA
ncbi:MAG: PhzF family phenazine biosynthesis protein [Acidobacteriota bacterium]